MPKAEGSRNGLTGYHVRDRFLVYNRPKEIPAIFCSGGEIHGFYKKTRDGVDSGLSRFQGLHREN